MDKSFDVIIIGAGSAGLYAVSQVQRETDNFILVNDGPLGTTCARVGCMPSKALIEAAKIIEHEHELRKDLGLPSSAETPNLNAVLQRVRRLRDRFVSGILSYVDTLESHLVKGRARFLEANLIEVNGEHYRAKKIILATGSRPVVPEAWKAFGDRVVTTDDFFELNDVPHKIGVVGLGIIGTELGEALAQLGVEVIGVEATQKIAGISDPVVLAEFSSNLSKRMELWLNTLAALSQGPNGKITLSDGKGKNVDVDLVLAALGRRPNIDNLGLENLGIDTKDYRKLINEKTMQIANLPIFIAGDVSQLSPLLHEAGDEGLIAGWNTVQSNSQEFTRRVPLRIAFTTPQVAAVGKTFSEVEHNTDMLIAEGDFSHQSRAMTMVANEGRIRIYVEKSTGRIIGAEMAIPGAEHIAHWLALVIDKQMTVSELLAVQPFYHPTLQEGVADALRSILRKTPQAYSPGPGLRKT